MRYVTSFTLVLIVLARTATAQTAQLSLTGLEGDVRTGDKIVVVTSDGAKVGGRLRELTADALALDTRHGLETLPATRIGHIVIKDSIRNGFWIGLGIGAAVGLTGGLLVNAICVNEAGSCPGAVLGLTAIGAGAGAGIGAGVDGLRHGTVFPRVDTHLALGQPEERGSSGSTQINLTRQWSLRPEVTFDRTDMSTHLRVGLGLGVGW